MSRYLVTGHLGYIGNHLYKQLLSLPGQEVTGIDLKEGNDILHCLPDKNYDCVFHLAALPRVEYSVENPFYTMNQNVLVTSKLLEWSKNHGVKRFIFSSSSSALGNGHGPTSPYGLHKLMSEMECKLYSELYGLDTVCLRYFNVFSEDQEFGGSYSTVVCAWMEMIKQKKLLRLDGDGTQSRDFVHVDDIVDINLFCMNHRKTFNGEIYDVGSGITMTVNDIKDIVQCYNDVEFYYTPERKGDPKHTKANIENLKNIGWTAKINPIMAIHNCFNAKKQ